MCMQYTLQSAASQYENRIPAYTLTHTIYPLGMIWSAIFTDHNTWIYQRKHAKHKMFSTAIYSLMICKLLIRKLSSMLYQQLLPLNNLRRTLHKLLNRPIGTDISPIQKGSFFGRQPERAASSQRRRIPRKAGQPIGCYIRHDGPRMNTDGSHIGILHGNELRQLRQGKLRQAIAGLSGHDDEAHCGRDIDNSGLVGSTNKVEELVDHDEGALQVDFLERR